MNILKIFGLVLLACGAYLLVDDWLLPWFNARQAQHLPALEQAPVRFSRPAKVEAAPAAASVAPVQANRRCDGRTHCSQMTSCAEARFFLANCPDTEMDGDRDGDPCERQWCKRASK
ncbi:excalibur calcium-binding domain-containing protein [Methylophilus sp.]|uniref:excalibur calcium-binding domain-containing protein n=1 Tax=Methylophilus sp. TaxID=29541 RepID=UPI004035062F